MLLWDWKWNSLSLVALIEKVYLSSAILTSIYFGFSFSLSTVSSKVHYDPIVKFKFPFCSVFQKISYFTRLTNK
jgi:hypothetical protein